jgi:magnesium-transporting ATPase (P-type)
MEALADDNFASIVADVEEGRFAYDNVRKVIYLLISTGAAVTVISRCFSAKLLCYPNTILNLACWHSSSATTADIATASSKEIHHR